MKQAAEALNKADLRPTRQRVALLELLLADGDRHLTPESLHLEAKQAGVRVSLATVYNTLNQFTDRGLLRRVTIDPGRTYFDTNVSNHHHFFDEVSQQLTDLPVDSLHCAALPEPPEGKTIQAVDIVVRIA